MSPPRLLVLLLVGVSSTATAGSIKCRVELGLVVDTTKSIGFKNIPRLKGFLRQLVQRFDISKDGTHVSLETFDKESTLHNKFNNSDYYSQEAVLKLINESISKLNQPTRLDKALNLADQEMFVLGNGERAGIRSVMVIFTDGKSHPRLTVKEDYTRFVASLQGKGVRIVAVGIGNFSKKTKFRNVLRLIAGDNVFFVDDYDVLDSKGAVDDILKIICPPAVCENSAGFDAAFLVDRTQSIGKKNFPLLKGFLLQIFDALDISSNGTHTGIILFDKEAQVLNKFSDSDLHSTEAVHNLIEKIPDRLGSPTRIDRALEAAIEELFTEEGGDRPGFPNVLVLLTDGRTNPKSKPFNETIPLLKEKNVRLVAVGVGKNIYEKELEEIAGNNTYSVKSFSDLPDFFTTILNETCSVDGGFSRWSFWSKCSVTCGFGIETRTRNCTHPKPQGFGKGCVGQSTEIRTCPKAFCSEGHIQQRLFDSRFRGKLSELKEKFSEPLSSVFVEETFPRPKEEDFKEDKDTVKT